MSRKLAAVATILVFILFLVDQNSAYSTIIERQLKICRKNSQNDDSRVPRWGWWPGPHGPVVSISTCIAVFRTCIVYAFSLYRHFCNWNVRLDTVLKRN